MGDAQQLDGIFRDEWGRLLAILVAQYRRLDLAEDGLSEAFLAAATHWPDEGMPGNPAGWLLTTARRKILDRLRGEATAARKEPLLVVDAELQQQAQRVMADGGDALGDERLRLMFVCADPALAPDAAAALTLRLVLGVPTADIAGVFHTAEATMAARLTRAKRAVAQSGARFAVPEGDDLPPRLATVCRIVYLAFTTAYAPARGSEVTRVAVAAEAIRLGRLLTALRPEPAEARALLALMLLQHSRRDARTDATGRLVLLPDQDRSRWRADEITEGLGLLQPMLTGTWSGLAGEYFLQGLIAAEHAVAARAEDTRWDRIAADYAELERLTGSPVVRLNRAVAVAEAEGPTAGLALLDGLDAALPRSHRLAAVRAALLADLDESSAARAAYARALELCGNDLEAEHLRGRLAALNRGTGPGPSSPPSPSL
jgi:predicted RNA polymerase sigma factor